MPILKVMTDRSLDALVDASATELIERASKILEDGLASERASPQIILQPGAILSDPFKVYVDLQFRATPMRNQERVTAVLSSLSDVLTATFHTPVRLRGFSIDQGTLSAVDAKPSDKESGI